MISSMTAFARNSVQKDWGNATWELRSVNHRYLELSIRLPDSFRDLELALRERITQEMKRGKIECILKHQHDTAGRGLSINQSLVKELAKAASEVKQFWTDATSANLLSILSWPNVIQPLETDVTAMQQDVLASFNQVLTDALAMRVREGEALKQFIEKHLKNIEIQIKKVQERVPQVLSQQHRKIMERLKEFKFELSPERVEQEWLMLAQKMDITEELDRIEAHIKEMRHTLQGGGTIGRRLDFLTQELHREVNTLCSKSSDSDVAHAGVELKVLIEQIREQAQNVE